MSDMPRGPHYTTIPLQPLASSIMQGKTQPLGLQLGEPARNYLWWRGYCRILRINHIPAIGQTPTPSDLPSSVLPLSLFYLSFLLHPPTLSHPVKSSSLLLSSLHQSTCSSPSLSDSVVLSTCAFPFTLAFVRTSRWWPISLYSRFVISLLMNVTTNGSAGAPEALPSWCFWAGTNC